LKVVSLCQFHKIKYDGLALRLSEQLTCGHDTTNVEGSGCTKCVHRFVFCASEVHVGGTQWYCGDSEIVRLSQYYRIDIGDGLRSASSLHRPNLKAKFRLDFTAKIVIAQEPSRCLRDLRKEHVSNSRLRALRCCTLATWIPKDG